MQVLKGGTVMFIITLSLFIMTSSMATIHEDPSSIGVKRKVPGGPNPIHHPPHLLEHHHLIEVKRNVPGGPNPIHHPPVLEHHHLIESKRKVPGGPNPIHHPPTLREHRPLIEVERKVPKRL
ncbi:hypothetical protein EUTSA_v10000574mg [Eutrema salsugineum]|uniref:Uncharacterized protein n=1 Tax=Eutrema salsugineum TaxID=72664 RepID=V4LV85_EUTSA|nr:hypothetical protein EUTSA_v10000574mg [Eutrema salsugineum]